MAVHPASRLGRANLPANPLEDRSVRLARRKITIFEAIRSRGSHVGFIHESRPQVSEVASAAVTVVVSSGRW